MVDVDKLVRIAALNFYMLKGTDGWLLHSYGVDRDWILAQLVKQEGCCDCCRADLESTRWCVDHSHETNKVRGLLCRSCNLAVRKLERVRQVMAYLIKYKEGD